MIFHRHVFFCINIYKDTASRVYNQYFKQNETPKFNKSPLDNSLFHNLLSSMIGVPSAYGSSEAFPSEYGSSEA